MVEFCEKCGGMLFPSKNEIEAVLICNSCGESISLKSDMKNSYISNKEIHHPLGEEYKNLKKMKNWKKEKTNK
jgi:DNA-directed RNA polymerase subunit M/transcription elongation factor TFIIS